MNRFIANSNRSTYLIDYKYPDIWYYEKWYKEYFKWIEEKVISFNIS